MSGFSPPIASATALGLIKVGAGLSITAGVLAATGAASPATTTTLGSVVVPTTGGLLVDGSGNLTLGIATAGQLGGVRVGSGLAINAGTGVLSATGASPPLATTTTAGTVIVPVSGHLAVDGSGNISAAIATVSTLGLVQVPTSHGLSVDGSGNVAMALATNAAAGTVIVPTANGLSVTAGSVALALGTAGTAGAVSVPSANGLSVTGGAVAMGLASSSVFGTVKVDGSTITASGGVISAAGGPASGLTLISTQTANNTAIDLQWTGLGSTYTNYLLVISSLVPVTSGGDAFIQFGTGAGPSWITSGYNGSAIRTVGGAVVSVYIMSSASSINVGSAITSGASTHSGYNASLTIMNIPTLGATYTNITGDVFADEGGSGLLIASLGAQLVNTTPITSIRIRNGNSNNWFQGQASLFGYAP